MPSSRPKSQPTPCMDCDAPVARGKGWKQVARCASCVERADLRRAITKAKRQAARAALFEKRCEWCLQPFTATTTAQKFCCDAHNNIAKSQRRKARLRGAAVGEPPVLWAVYERDGGRCGLCGDGVERSIKWPDTRCASLDHIVPISRGGTDGSDNVQLAHLGCNQAKQNRLPGETRRPRRVA